MKKIANLKDIKKGESMYFTLDGKKGILIRTKDNDLVAYSSVCPHEGGEVEWDNSINRILCECHMVLFNVEDGSIYKHSTGIDVDKGLEKIEVMVDGINNILAV